MDWLCEMITQVRLQLREDPLVASSASKLPILEFLWASYCLSIVFKCRFRTPHLQKKFLV